MKGWTKEYSKKKDGFMQVQHGLKTNSSGTGSYIRISGNKEKGYDVRMWSGNSIGFPHSGGAHGFEHFDDKKKAIAYAENWMKKHPGYKKDGSFP